MTAVLLAGCTPNADLPVPSLSETPVQQLTSSTQSFKEEYESLNIEGNVHMQVPTDIQVYSLDFAQTQEFLTKGTGILYFGFPTCPWCRNLLPELFATMQKNQISDLYYFNPKSIRDKKTLDEN